jgi:hypothetical protein
MRCFGLYRIIALLAFLVSMHVDAQVTGVVYDSKSRKPVDYVNVYYKGKGVGGQTDEKGRFEIGEREGWNQLTFSSIGYVTQVVNLVPGKKKNLVVRLVPEARKLDAVTITAKKKRYTRKNNPAVDLMQNVISKKNITDLKSYDYYTYKKYEKMTFSINEVTEEIFEDGKRKNFEFMKEHVEVCPETGKKILPITVNERLSEIYYRKTPNTEKILVKAESDKGINELINTGEILTTMLKDVFTDVDIYDNECRLLQYQFKSPIADNAIGFYRYFLEDTLFIEEDKVVEVSFVPNNPQDFGFSGRLFVMADSSYQVRRVVLNIPSRSDVNFVENMVVKQDFKCLPTGEFVVANNDMLIEIKVASWLNKLQVQRNMRNTDYSFQSVPDDVFRRIKGDMLVEPDARMQTEKFWSQIRQVELTKSEKNIGSFISRIQQIKGFKYFIFAAKALIENFIETSDSLEKNKFDFGPINTTISYNHYDKTRFRVSGFTTANLHPQIFLGGYVAYGTNSKNVYGKLDITYSFNRKAYLQREFPKNNLTFSYMNDVMSPFDKFLPTDKDNMFLAFKAGKVDQFNHVNEFKLLYDREWENGLKFYSSFSSMNSKPVDALFYQPLGTGEQIADTKVFVPTNDPSKWVESMRTSEFKASISYEPGATYVNTKQRRHRVNQDAPIYTLSHTMGVDGLLGGEYNYHVTEASVYKRFWLGSWGKIDADMKAGVQWSKVPFPLLIHPSANQSYIVERGTFNLINNLEFLNDRYVSLMTDWDLNGKVFNRIPLLRQLKWREMIGVNVLWGTLTDKNNPAFLDYTDKDLFYFPGHFQSDGTYKSNTYVMNPKEPYVELRLGIHNIFKLFHVEYVRRLTYLDHQGINKDGIRLMFKVSF